jgi:chaperone BCS1
MLTGRNEFASVGLLLMIIGAVSVWLRAVPEKLWHWAVSQTTMIVTVKDDDAAFVWIKEWFLEQSFLKRIRRVDLDTTLRNEHRDDPVSRKTLFWFGGRPLKCGSPALITS